MRLVRQGGLNAAAQTVGDAAGAAAAVLPDPVRDALAGAAAPAAKVASQARCRASGSYPVQSAGLGAARFGENMQCKGQCQDAVPGSERVLARWCALLTSLSMARGVHTCSLCHFSCCYYTCVARQVAAALTADPQLGAAAAAAAVGVPAVALWRARYGGFAGVLAPEAAFEALQEGDSVLVDMRCAKSPPHMIDLTLAKQVSTYPICVLRLQQAGSGQCKGFSSASHAFFCHESHGSCDYPLF